MFCSKCGTQYPQDSAFCPHCGQAAPAAQASQAQPAYAAPASGGQGLSAVTGIWQKHKLPIIIGIAVLLAGIITLILVLALGRGLVGTWEMVEIREYENGRLEAREHVRPGEMTLEFQRNGLLIMHESGWGSEVMQWERLGGGRLRVSERGEWGEVVEYRVQGNELRLTEREAWGGGVWEEVIVFRRR